MNVQKKQIRPFRIGKKKTVLFLGILFGYLAFIFVYVYFYQKNTVKYSLENNHNTMTLVGNNLIAEFDNISNMSKLIIINDKITNYLKYPDADNLNTNRAVVSELYDILTAYQRIYSLFVFRNDGKYISTGIGVTKVVIGTILDPKWRAEVDQEAGGYVLKSNHDGTFTTNTNQELISFVRNINDIDNQKKIGLLVINLPAGRLENSYINLTTESRMFAYYDEHAKKIYANNPINNIDPLIASLEQSENAFTQYINDSTIFSAYRINGTPLILICKEKIRKTENIPSGMIIAFILMFLLILLVFKLVNELFEKEKSLREKELAFLQEQINPHFLYNTISSIAYLALEKSSMKVFDALETLGEFYHNFLSRGSAEIPLRTEIAIVKDYLKLQRLRYQDIFEEIYEIDESLLDIQVPKLILQPLVENCLYHGIQPKGEKGIIKLQVFSKDDLLYIVIFDNGVGMDEDTIKQIMESNNNKSFGFRGTIERIQNYYDRKNVFSIRSEVGEFTEISLLIPQTIRQNKKR